MRHNWAVAVLIATGVFQALLTFKHVVDTQDKTERVLALIMGLVLCVVVWSAI